MTRWSLVPLAFPLVFAIACGGGLSPRSQRSFDEIAVQVDALSAGEIAASLGEPDSRQAVFLRDERWIWWNYTFLDGEDYPPEVRGQVVHLEITFRNPSLPGGERRPTSEWRIAQPYGIAYRTPGAPPGAAAAERVSEPAGALR